MRLDRMPLVWKRIPQKSVQNVLLGFATCVLPESTLAGGYVSNEVKRIEKKAQDIKEVEEFKIYQENYKRIIKLLQESYIDINEEWPSAITKKLETRGKQLVKEILKANDEVETSKAISKRDEFIKCLDILGLCILKSPASSWPKIGIKIKSKAS